jgi:hypothetical protein
MAEKKTFAERMQEDAEKEHAKRMNILETGGVEALELYDAQQEANAKIFLGFIAAAIVAVIAWIVIYSINYEEPVRTYDSGVSCWGLQNSFDAAEALGDTDGMRSWDRKMERQGCYD